VTPAAAVDTVSLFPEVNARLIELLRKLDAADWLRPACKGWTVKDVAAHLLDGMVRRLSYARDGHQTPGSDLSGYASLVRYLDQLNAEWVAAANRLSPRVLIDLLAWAGPQVHEWFAGLDPKALAPFPVSWAGEATSANWLDIAREYTEHWHHQQQIRDAVSAEPLYEPHLFRPVVATFVRSLPRVYHGASADVGTTIRFIVSGNSGGAWLVARELNGWQLYEDGGTPAQAQVRIPEDAAWRVFTKGLDGVTARKRAVCEGPEELLAPAFRAVAVMG
jgi:uncharacterized protein (TIGR03083 family)